MRGIVEAFRSVEGGELRVLATLRALDYEIEYIRDDLEAGYSDADLDRAYQAMMANQVSTDDFSRVGAFGPLETQSFFFEDVVVFLFPSSRYEGVFASYDRSEDFPVLDVVEIGTEAAFAFDEEHD